MVKNWDSSERWYTSCVGEKGHYYHQAVVLPNALRLLGKKGSLLDLGCGQGVLARHLDQKIDYFGVDQSKELISSAKKMTKRGQFFLADVTQGLPIEKKDFDLPEIFITVEPPLVEGTDYILMIIDMQDRDGNYMEFDTGIYDFSTPASESETAMNETGTGATGDTISTATPQQDGNTVTSEENTTT